MTMLSDLKAGQQFLFAAQVTAIDGAGYHLSLFGPAEAAAGTAVISPAGAMSGQLAAAPNAVPVTVVTGFAPVAVGDVLESQQTGETAVARWSQIGPDGTVTWSASAGHRVVYPAAGWTTIGHVAL